MIARGAGARILRGVVLLILLLNALFVVEAVRFGLSDGPTVTSVPRHPPPPRRNRAGRCSAMEQNLRVTGEGAQLPSAEVEALLEAAGCGKQEGDAP